MEGLQLIFVRAPPSFNDTHTHKKTPKQNNKQLSNKHCNTCWHLWHTRSLHGGFLKLTQQNCNRIKSDGCTICLLDAKIAFGCFIFYILLSLSFCSVCAAREKSLPELLLMQPPSVPWEPVRSLWICSQTRSKTHTHRKADVCAKGHLPPNLCTNTPEHQCLVRQRTNISPPLESTHTSQAEIPRF